MEGTSNPTGIHERMEMERIERRQKRELILRMVSTTTWGEDEDHPGPLVPANTIASLDTGESLINGGDCAICLDEISEGQQVTKMPCSHKFHKECIVKWLNKSYKCPVCRFVMPTILSAELMKKIFDE